MQRQLNKKQSQDLAYFGGNQLFSNTKSTSSLAQPSFERFLFYSKQFYERRHYTNNGILVQLLEKRLAEFHKTEFCITFCSGFWALALTISAVALKGKGEIIMPSLTYRRMADLCAWVGLIPRFCEVDAQTLAMSRQTAKACITDQTALILGVHPIVNCCDVEGIAALGEEKSIPVIFDSVESMYEYSPLGKVGGKGQAECFSMHASKLLNGFEGGYVTIDNAELALHLKRARSFGFEGQDNCVAANGMNAKLNEIHAALALANLDELQDLVERNKKRYKKYQELLPHIHGIRLLEFNEALPTSYKNIVVELLEDWPIDRDRTVALLNAENILARAYYSPALHQRNMQYPHIPAMLPITDDLARKYILMPCGEFVTGNDIASIIQFLGFIYEHAAEISAFDQEGRHAG